MVALHYANGQNIPICGTINEHKIALGAGVINKKKLFKEYMSFFAIREKGLRLKYLTENESCIIIE